MVYGAGLARCSDSEADSHSRPIDSCITQLKGQGPSRICNESNEEEEEGISAVGCSHQDGLQCRV